MEVNMNLGALLIAGLVSGVAAPLFARLPILNMVNCIPCGWIWISGIMTLLLYRWLIGSSEPLTTMDGLIAGTYTGLIAFAVTTAIFFLTNKPFQLPEVPANLAPHIADIQDSLGLKSQDQTLMFMGSCVNLFVYPTFSSVGGIIGILLFGGSRSKRSYR
jgi:hypothetical protein